jgi:hypothetical protein
VSALFGRDPAEPLRTWVGSPEQVVGIDVLEFCEGDARGVRLVRMRAGDVEVDVLVERALDLMRATVRGVPVGWLSPAGVRHPAYAEPTGFGPLRTFGGGLLTTCGLDNVHGPRDEPDADGHPGIGVRHHPLHGRISTSPARLLRAQVERGEAGRPPTLVVEGEARQAVPFGEHLVLRRRIELDVGRRTVRVADTVRNDGFAPAPLAVLYHVNVGWPVLSPSAEVATRAGEPVRTAGAGAGRDWRSPGGPEVGGQESVWEHSLLPSVDGRAHAAVLNDDIGDGRAVGLLVSWQIAALPHLAQWTMPAAGMYAVGIEPSTVGIDGVEGARARGDLRMLAPGSDVELGVELTLLHGDDDLAAARSLTGA